MNVIRLLGALSFAAISIVTNAQVDGLWAVKSVMVGAENKTPVARWFRLEHGTHVSGNGWQQHSTGSYIWNKKTSELSFETVNEPRDEFGAFKVERKGNAMTWTRKEEGILVKVELEVTNALPQSTADQIKGLWDLVAATRSGTDVLKQTDPDGNHFIFIRWDRMYVKQLKSDEQIRGYWFVNAHQPELKFFSLDNEQDSETWMVSFDTEKLVLTGTSESVKDLVLMYSRMTDFPN
jgi:hypothetical protein